MGLKRAGVITIACMIFSAGCLGDPSGDELESTSEPQPVPKWHLGSATADSLSLSPGGSTTLRWTLQNEGDGKGNFSAPLRINREFATNLTAEVSPGESTTLSYTFRPTETGVYVIELGDATPLSIAVRQPSDIQIVRMELSRHEVTIGETVVVTYEAANKGGMSGEKEFGLTVNGKEVRSEHIALGPGASTEKTISIAVDTRGINVVRMGDHEEKFTALKPAEFTFTNLTLPPSPVAVGDPVRIQVTVLNEGDIAGEAAVALTIDDVIRTSQRQPLEPSEQKTIELQWTPDESRTYSISIGSLPIQTLVAKMPAAFELSNFAVAPSSVEPGQTVTARITLRNVGELEGSFPLRFLVDGGIQSENHLTLPGGGERLFETSWSSPFPNTYLLSFEGTSGSTVKVLRPAQAAFEPVTLSTRETDAGSPVIISGVVRNIGEVPGTFTVPYVVNGKAVSTATVQVAPGGSAAVPEFTYTPTEGGSHTITIGDASPLTLNVRVPDLRMSASFEDWYDTVEVTVTIVNNGAGVAKDVILDVWESNGKDQKQTLVGDIQPNGRVTKTLVLHLNDPDWGCTYYTILWKATPQYGSASDGSGRYCQ